MCRRRRQTIARHRRQHAPRPTDTDRNEMPAATCPSRFSGPARATGPVCVYVSRQLPNEMTFVLIEMSLVDSTGQYLGQVRRSKVVSATSSDLV